MKNNDKQISSPFSTSGGGFTFENKVQSAFVALMLTGGPVPTQLSSTITSVKLQRRYEERNIDDIVVECKDPQTNITHKLLAQVKHSISITKSDGEFSDVISAAWSDFNDSEKFSKENDTIALITGPLSKVDTDHVRAILDWARHSESPGEFFQKVATPNFSSDDKRNKLATFKYLLEQANGGSTPDDEDIWQFMKCFYLIGYDFDRASGSNLSLIQSMLKLSITEKASPDEVWSKLINEVQKFNADAGTITLQTLPKDIRDYFRQDVSLVTCRSIEKLKEHGYLILKGINISIAGTHVTRIRYIDRLSDIANKCNFIIVTGSRGSGKSAVTKEFIEEHAKSEFCFCLRAEDLNKAHLDQVFTSIGVEMSLAELSARFALIPRKYLIIESLEKLLELENRSAFCDLLEYLKEHEDWTVIASCREYAFRQICLTYLQQKGVLHEFTQIDDFSDTEFNALLQAHPSLKTLTCHEKLNKFLRNPFMADMAIRVLNSSTQSNVIDEATFKKAVWQNVIRKESDRSKGMPTKRCQAFMQISKQRAKQMLYEISESEFDSEVLYRLESDGLICRNSEKCTVRPSHDVLEDWAIEGFIDKAYCGSMDTHAFLESIGSEPAILRAFRFWLHQKLNVLQGHAGITKWCADVLANPDIPSYWHDEIIITILSGQYTDIFLSNLKNWLLDDQHKLLKRFCFLMRVVCKNSNIDAMQGVDDKTKECMSFLLYKASGDCWPQLIRFIYQNRNDIKFDLLPEVPLILEDYSNLANFAKKNQPEAFREVGLLALALFEKVKNKYHSELQQKLLKIILRVFPTIENEFRELLKCDVFGRTYRDRPSYVDHLTKYILVDFDSAILSRYAPDLVIELAWQEWILEEEHHHSSYRISRREVEQCFGLSHDDISSGFHPASGLKGPFSSLLLWHESKGLDFILELCNYCAEKYVKSQLDGQRNYQVDVVLNDGTINKQYCSGRLWGGYRGITVLPNLLQSALMALENWLIGKAKQENEANLPKTLADIIEKSNSVMTTAVAASIATGFPEKAGDAVWPLLRTAEFFGLDTQRRLQDSGFSSVNWHRSRLCMDAYSEIYAQERDSSNSHKWRKEELEFLICKLQFTSMRDKAFEIIDNYFKKFAKEGPDSENWRFRLSRTDMRNCKAVEDIENNCIRFESKELEPDLQKKSEEAQKQMEEMNSFASLFLWSDKEFRGEPTAGTQYERDFESILPEIKQKLKILSECDDPEKVMCHIDGIIKGVAILIRDYADKLGESDLAWCTEFLLNKISEGLKCNEPITMQMYGKSIIEVVQILPIILKLSENSNKEGIRKFIVEALTHYDFRKSIATGIQKYLWSIEADFAQRCFDGAFEIMRLQNEFHGYHYDEGLALKYHEKITMLQDQILNNLMPIDPNQVSFDTHESSGLLIPFLMLPSKTYDEQHESLFIRIITLIQDATAEEKKRYNARKESFDSSQQFEFVKALTKFLAISPADRQDFIVQFILNRIGDSFVLVDDLLLFYLVESEQVGTTDRFWKLWKEIAKVTQNDISNILSGRRENRDGLSMMRRLMFADFPMENSNHKEELSGILENGKKDILDFAKNTCFHVKMFEFFTRLIFLFPKLFLTEGLLILSSNAKENNEVLSGVNTVYYLERLLHQLLIYNNTSNKINQYYFDAFLALLNAMINQGSTAAFFIRDHLLTMKRV